MELYSTTEKMPNSMLPTLRNFVRNIHKNHGIL